MGRVPTLLFLALAPLGFGLATLALGMDANWDLRNYHYYNAYAWLTGRGDRDILPAQINGFFNPLIDVPFYLATRAWPARLVGFLLGTLQGLNLVPLYGIAHGVLRIAAPERRRLAAAALALLGMAGVGALSELGTTFYDNVVSLGPLTALWLILARHDAILRGPLRQAFDLLLAAGLMSGIAVGLKQPVVSLPIGLCLAFLAAPAAPARRLGCAFLFGVGVLLGMAASGGFWMLHLWNAYGNPLFPFYNQLFRSPWALAKDYREFFYIPPDPWVRVFFPFAYLLDPRLTAEADFRDLRLLACFVLVPLAGAAALLRRARRQAATPSFLGAEETRYLLVAFAAGYVAWALVFGIYRYAMAYEMLAPLVIAAAIGLLPLGRRARGAAILGTLALVIATVQPFDWGRVSWSAKWVSAEPPKLADPDHTLVLITGHEPLAYLIPFFPPAVRFLRIHSGFTGPYEPGSRFNIEMHRIVAAHRGPLYLLYNPNEAVFAERHLPAYGLAIDRRACRLVPSNIGYVPYLLCALRPAG